MKKKVKIIFYDFGQPLGCEAGGAVKKKKKKVAMVWCHYKGSWIPMGRSRKKCPGCDAVLKNNSAHKIRKR